MDHDNRVVVLIDMDCFYCQVEEKLDPELKGKPIAVVQYNPWKGGGIIAVNYVARAMGVTRHMRGDEAKAKCPEILLPSVPCQRGKADITKYRDAGKEVAKILQRFTPLLERASIDEAYMDITATVQERLKSFNTHEVTSGVIPNTYALGYNNIEDFMSDVHGYGNDSIDFDHEHARRLLVGAVIVSEVRAAVFDVTGYTCSAGIAHNKILAKLVCGMNKPNKQTILPKHSINILYKSLSIKKVKHLGGKFGDTVCEVLKIVNMGELQSFSEKELQTRFDEKNGTWLYNIARGIDREPVQAKFNPKSIGCCKQLRGKSSLRDLDSLRKWLKDLGDEIEDRLEKDALENNRTPKQMVASFGTQLSGWRDMSSSRSYNFVSDDELCGDLFSNKALELVMEGTEGVKVKDGEPNRKLKAPILFLGISVGKFEDNESKKTKKILDYFGAGSSNVTKVKTDEKHNGTKDTASIKISRNKEDKEYILQKFFQVTEKSNKFQNTNLKVEEETVHSTIHNVGTNDSTKTIDSDGTNLNSEAVLQSTLAAQESFFAKYLIKEDSKTIVAEQKDNAATRPTTPVCNVVSCGDDSNDTEISGSTINMEIDRSIALFDDDPEDQARVSSMRELLNSTARNCKNGESSNLQPQLGESPTNKDTEVATDPKFHKIASPDKLVRFECPECKKTISVDKFEEHSDYHLALKLREEERQQVRLEIKEFNKGLRNKTKTKKQENKECIKKATVNDDLKGRKPTVEQKIETLSSIASFFVKLDDRIPTEICSECGQKVAADKLAEHLDFHEAQKLSRQLNKKSTPSHFTISNVKRKRKTVSPVKKTKLPCNSRSIDSFFR